MEEAGTAQGRSGAATGFSPWFRPTGSAPFLPGGRSGARFPTTTIPLSGRGKADRIAGSLSRGEEREPR